MRVLLVCMPFSGVGRPPLGISLLRAALVREGVECDIAYPNLRLAETLGAASYDRIADQLPVEAMAGEWVFSAALNQRGRSPDQEYVDEILRARWKLPEQDVDLIRDARSQASRFLRELFATVAWDRYQLVGFTSSFMQNAASLALARMIKEKYPQVLIVFGGANWYGVMGREFHHKVPFADFICSGEADSSLPRLAKHLGASTRNSLPDIPGVVYRQGSRTVATAETPVDDLDGLPFPDYSDYFDALRTHRAALASFPCIQVEMSRGCAWAVKGPCRFCGLNGGTRTFREKSPARFLTELRSLASLWPTSFIGLADNAVPSSFFSYVLPKLAERPLASPLFVELRPDMTRSDMALLADARVSIQPGIESLSDHVLRLMHKGTRALENLRLLRWAASEGVKVYWNLLYGFPGETQPDYEEIQALLPAIQHLQPPASCAALRMDRFSSFFENPERYGFSAVRPGAAYRHIYPFGEKALRRVAYSFDYDYKPGVESPPTDELRRQVTAWQKDHLHGELRAFDAAGETMWLLDTRPGSAVRRVRLDSLDAALYRACEDICSRSEAGRRVRAELGESAAHDDEIERRLSSFVERRLMANTGDRFLSLALTGRPAGLPGA